MTADFVEVTYVRHTSELAGCPAAGDLGLERGRSERREDTGGQGAWSRRRCALRPPRGLSNCHVLVSLSQDPGTGEKSSLPREMLAPTPILVLVVASGLPPNFPEVTGPSASFVSLGRCIMKSIHHCIAQSIFTALKFLCSVSSPYPLQTLATTDLFIVSTALPFPECRVVALIQYDSLFRWASFV